MTPTLGFLMLSLMVIIFCVFCFLTGLVLIFIGVKRQATTFKLLFVGLGFFFCLLPCILHGLVDYSQSKDADACVGEYVPLNSSTNQISLRLNQDRSFLFTNEDCQDSIAGVWSRELYDDYHIEFTPSLPGTYAGSQGRHEDNKIIFWRHRKLCTDSVDVLIKNQ